MPALTSTHITVWLRCGQGRPGDKGTCSCRCLRHTQPGAPYRQHSTGGGLLPTDHCCRGAVRAAESDRQRGRPLAHRPCSSPTEAMQRLRWRGPRAIISSVRLRLDTTGTPINYSQDEGSLQDTFWSGTVLASPFTLSNQNVHCLVYSLWYLCREGSRRRGNVCVILAGPCMISRLYVWSPMQLVPHSDNDNRGNTIEGVLCACRFVADKCMHEQCASTYEARRSKLVTLCKQRLSSVARGGRAAPTYEARVQTLLFTSSHTYTYCKNLGNILADVKWCPPIPGEYPLQSVGYLCRYAKRSHRKDVSLVGVCVL